MGASSINESSCAAEAMSHGGRLLKKLDFDSFFWKKYKNKNLAMQREHNRILEHNSNEFMSFPIENPNQQTPQTDTDLLQQVRIILYDMSTRHGAPW